MRLGFAGTPQFAVPALDALGRSRHRLVGVFTQPDRPAGRGQEPRSSPVKVRALETGLPIYQPPTFKTGEAPDALRALDLDALVVVAYGLLLPAAALAIPRLGCFNIHASLLPRWRGAAPIQRALLAGDAVTGVSIMRMDVGLDTGPVLAEREVAIADGDTARSLHDRLSAVGAELLLETLDAVAEGLAREHPQRSSGITYAEKITKAEALIDWHVDARSILRRVRAFNPWPVAETHLAGAQVRIWDAELGPGVAADRPPPAPAGSVIRASDDGIDVACGEGVLRIVRLQLAGRRPLPAAQFLKGQPLSGASFA